VGVGELSSTVLSVESVVETIVGREVGVGEGSGTGSGLPQSSPTQVVAELWVLLISMLPPQERPPPL
jgi:hypothetical protein